MNGYDEPDHGRAEDFCEFCGLEKPTPASPAACCDRWIEASCESAIRAPSESTAGRPLRTGPAPGEEYMKASHELKSWSEYMKGFSSDAAGRHRVTPRCERCGWAHNPENACPVPAGRLAQGPSEEDFACAERIARRTARTFTTEDCKDSAALSRVLGAAVQAEVRLAAQEMLMERCRYFRARVEKLEGAIRDATGHCSCTDCTELRAALSDEAPPA